LAVALATVYASDAEQGVRGLQYPFAGVTLASASAHVARAVWTVGVEATGLPALVAAARRGQRPDGGFGDGAQPSDVLTTVACAELLGRVDPGFDLEAPARWLADQQGGDGLLRVFGPDGAWLTGVAMDLWEDAQRGFSARFLWPQALPAARDRKTGLPFYAWFDDLATTLGALPGLSSAPLELAFLDLAGFRAFNNAYGQALGDRVLQAFAEHLQALPEARVVRDGGDELLVLGAPGRASLRASLDAHRVAWPSRFRAVFGDEAPPVAPRIVVARTVGGALRACREALGRAVGVFKNSVPKVPPEGALDPTDHMLGMP
jgi:GGDEF domain-containing protein